LKWSLNRSNYQTKKAVTTCVITAFTDGGDGRNRTADTRIFSSKKYGFIWFDMVLFG